MKKNFLLTLIAALTMIFSGCTNNYDNPIPSPDNSEGAKKARYTVMIYGAITDPGSEFMERDIWEYLKPMLTDSTNVRVMVMYKYGPEPDGSQHNKYGRNGDVVCFELNSKMDFNSIPKNEEISFNDPELPMFHPAILAAFINISRQRCPAENYVLATFGHGHGFDLDFDYPKEAYNDQASQARTRSMMHDGNLKGQGMDHYEMAEALTMSDIHLKCLLLHNCLMGYLEVLTELAPYTDYFGASEHSLGGNSQALTWFVTHLLNRDLSIEDVAKQTIASLKTDEPFLKSYKNLLQNGDFSYMTSATVTKMNQQVKRLAERLVELYPTQQEAIDDAWLEAYPMTSLFPWLVDVCQYADIVASKTGDATLADIAKQLRQSFNDGLISHMEINNAAFTLPHYTLTVALPTKQKYSSYNGKFNIKDAYEYSGFHKQTSWGNWLAVNQFSPSINPASMRFVKDGSLIVGRWSIMLTEGIPNAHSETHMKIHYIFNSDGTGARVTYYEMDGKAKYRRTEPFTYQDETNVLKINMGGNEERLNYLVWVLGTQTYLQMPAYGKDHHFCKVEGDMAATYNDWDKMDVPE